MRARWLRFGLTLGVSLGVVGLALAIGMTRGNAPGAGAQSAATPTTAATPVTTLPSNPPTCTATTLGGTRTANAQLATDCDTLLAIETTLAGTDGLNWSPTLALASWEGITVGGTPKRVTAIRIHGGKRTSKLNGALATQLGNLTGLRRLDLNGHGLTGVIPTQLGNLTALTYIDLAGNALTGSLPTQLGGLTKLEYLWLWRTGLSGALPTQLGNLAKLRVLSFTGASLSGSIPTQLGGLASLTQINLGGNRLSGSIPTELGNLTALTRLRLENNRLGGSIPTQLGSLTALTELKLSGNSLTGCVPERLRLITANDISTLRTARSLNYCAVPIVSEGMFLTSGGTYQLGTSDLLDLIVDIPVGVHQIRFDYMSFDGQWGITYCLSDATKLNSRLCIRRHDSTVVVNYVPSTAVSGSSAEENDTPTIFDRIGSSARLEPNK